MIQDEREYQVTREQADRLRNALAALPSNPHERPAVDPRLQQAEGDAIRDLLDELEGELDEYEQLQSGQRTIASIKYLEELPRLLVSARTSAGLSRADLATRLEISEDELLELEQTAYASAPLALITRTMDTLGIRPRGGIRISYPVDEGWLASTRAELGVNSAISK